ncbi:MAG: hypothetical protein Q9222_006292 [Ikaeria aurantiellina]
MASATNPTFVCLHGAWHSPASFDKIKHLLSIHGYGCVCPALPSTGADPPVKDFKADVDVVRSTVSELVEAKKEVVVLTHSYSGIPGGEALAGLDRQSRKEHGYEGGVIRMIYIMSFIVPEGFQHSQHGTRENMVPVMKTDLETGIVTVEPEDAKGLFYQDLSNEAALDLAKHLRPQSIGVYWSKTSYAAWKHIPTTYVICEDDSPSTVAAAGYLVSSAQKAEGSKVDRVLRHQVGHSPFLSQPEWTAQMLMGEVGKEPQQA